MANENVWQAEICSRDWRGASSKQPVGCILIYFAKGASSSIRCTCTLFQVTYFATMSCTWCYQGRGQKETGVNEKEQKSADKCVVVS
eukprot:975090-Pelagomonas_calceolata.AAC.1